jgi:enamine deaminase RidA (YjgF/YER057c/UK114 family)
MFFSLAQFLKEHDAKIMSQDIFGCNHDHEEGLAELRKACGEITWPLAWIEGDNCSHSGITSTQVYAIRGDSPRSIEMNGNIVGSVFEDDDARYCLIAGLSPLDQSLSREEQAESVFERMKTALSLADMTFDNVVRTWLYIDSILSWYDEFNTVRTNFFKENGVFGKLVPASTGIGCANRVGAALVSDVLAIQPKTDDITIQAIPSPLQCPALDYESSFSRAVEVDLPDHRRLYISGTASIEPGGATAHVGDTSMQISLTMDVVAAILESRDMTWTDVTRANAYFKDIDEAHLFDEYCKANNLPVLPAAIAHSDICRDDLLFEIELDAVVAK